MKQSSIRALQFLALTIPVLFIAGCGVNLYHKGSSAFDKGDYASAISFFEEAVAEQPEKAILWRQLGIAYYKTDQFEKAVDALKQATLLDADDGTSVLYLGLSNEVLGNKSEAVETYKAYLLTSADDDMSARVRQRIKYLNDTELQGEVKTIIQNESQIDAGNLPSNTVGLLGFKTEDIDPQYAVLGRGMAEMLTTDLAKVSAIKVVERMRLNEIRKELALSQTDMVDSENAPRLGRLVGAAKVVTGELSQPEADELSASAGLISTVVGIVEYTDAVGGKLQQFFTIEKDLLYNILDEMGYAPTDEERRRLDSIPTTSLLAFLAYSRGLDYADKGMYRLAEAEFQSALNEDPDFEAAEEALHSMAGLGEYTGSVEQPRQFESTISELTESATPAVGSAVGLRITRRAVGFQVDETLPREGDNPTVGAQTRGGVTVTGTFYPDEP